MLGDGDTDAATAIREHFLGWQCRIRQKAVRQEGGRPSQGMRPRILAPGGEELAEAVTVLIAEHDSEATTAQFRHIVKKTHDPRQRYEAATKLLASAYFQHPEDFSDRLTALFQPGSALARRLLAEGRAVLLFQQYGQSYRVPVAVEELGSDDPLWQATFWHNAMFNPAIPPNPHVLALEPDWDAATAFPPVETGSPIARAR